jgi:putative Ca2+/H+ antiporter (TMEM165/GDT1 family)
MSGETRPAGRRSQENALVGHVGVVRRRSVSSGHTSITPCTGAGPARLRQLGCDHVPGLLIAGVVFGTVLVAELPDNSGLASLVLSTRYRAGGVFAGAAAAFAVHVVLAVTCGSLLGLLPHKIVQIAVAVAVTSFVVILLAELGDLSDIVIANLAARYHDPVPVGIGSVLALWAVVVLAIVGGKGLQRILPLRWIARLAALVMVVMAGLTLAEAMWRVLRLARRGSFR